MSRSAPLHQAIEERLRAEIARRGLTPGELSKRAGYSERTALRLMTGQSVSWDSIERTENALRVDVLDCRCPGEGQDGAGRSRTEQPERPVVGWDQAAMVLDLSRWTFRRWRAELGVLDMRPWWPSRQVLHDWWWNLVSEGRSP